MAWEYWKLWFVLWSVINIFSYGEKKLMHTKVFKMLMLINHKNVNGGGV